jgi:hypothetical protein
MVMYKGPTINIREVLSTLCVTNADFLVRGFISNWITDYLYMY